MLCYFTSLEVPVQRLKCKRRGTVSALSCSTSTSGAVYRRAEPQKTRNKLAHAHAAEQEHSSRRNRYISIASPIATFPSWRPCDRSCTAHAGHRSRYFCNAWSKCSNTHHFGQLSGPKLARKASEPQVHSVVKHLLVHLHWRTSCGYRTRMRL